MTWNPNTAGYEVTVVPTSVLKQRKPRISDVIKMADFQWEEVRHSGQYKRVQLQPNPRDHWMYTRLR